MTQKHVTAVKLWSPLSFYCSALLDLSLVFFPGMSVSQPFPKGSGDNSVSSLVRMVDSLVYLYLISHTHTGYLCLNPIPTYFESTKNTQCQNQYHPVISPYSCSSVGAVTPPSSLGTRLVLTPFPSLSCSIESSHNAQQDSRSLLPSCAPSHTHIHRAVPLRFPANEPPLWVV